jgi:poly(A) polymerase
MIVRLCAPDSITSDPLRAMRALRMVARHTAMFTTETLHAVQAARLDLSEVSHERMRDELFNLLALREPLALMRRMAHLSHGGPSLLQQVLPEAAAQLAQVALPAAPGDETAHAAALSDMLAQPCSSDRTRAQLLRFALLHHPGCTPAQAAAVANRLRLTAEETTRVRTLIDALRGLSGLREAGIDSRTVHDWMIAAGDEAPLALWVALSTRPEAKRSSDVQVRALLDLWFARYQQPPAPLLSGADLITLGLSPGPRFGQLLANVRYEQLRGALTTRAAALDWVTSRAG